VLYEHYGHCNYYCGGIEIGIVANQKNQSVNNRMFDDDR